MRIIAGAIVILAGAIIYSAGLLAHQLSLNSRQEGENVSVLGHAHPRVVRAVENSLHHGASFGAPTEIETELAELICALVPSIEMVRMVSSGTEASMSAIRLARGFTGRDLIVKFAGCYHGHVDALLVSAGSSALTHGVPSSPGVPAGCTADTVVLRFNDVEG